MRIVPIVVIASRNSAAGALFPPDGPVLNIRSTAVDPVDIICATVARQAANKRTAAARVIRPKVLQDICLANTRPGVYSEVAVGARVKGTGEGNSPLDHVNKNNPGAVNI
jgi:hypothetical protein